MFEFKKTVGIVICILVLARAASMAQKSTATEKVDIFSDRLVYNQDKDIIHAYGNVKVLFRDMELNAKKIKYDRSKNTVEALKDINFTKENYNLQCERLKYNLTNSTGIVFKGKVNSPPVYVYADKIIIKGEDDFLIPSGDITTCSKYPPHYKFTGSDIHLKLKKRFTAFNTLMYIRGLPSFYYPYYTKSLTEKKFKTAFDAGRSSRNGYFVKAKLAYPVTDKADAYIGLDYMLKRGLGLKSGVTYKRENGFSDARGYYIKEKDTAINKGNLYLKGRQELFKDLNIRYRTEYTSDYKFNYDYDQETDVYKKDILYYQLGFEYSKSQYFTSIYGDRKDIWDGNKYIISDYVIPGIEFRLFPLKIFGGINFSGQTNYKNEYDSDKDSWMNNIEWKSNLSKNLSLISTKNYRTALIPEIGYRGRYKNNIRHFGKFSTGIRQNFLNMIFIEGDHLLIRQLKEPYSFEENKLDLKFTFNPSQMIYMAAETEYDFKENNKPRAEDIFSRIRLRYLPYRIYLRNRYDWYRSKSKEWLFEFDYSDISATRIKYNNSMPDKLEIDQGINFNIRPFSFMTGVKFRINETKEFYDFDEFVEQRLSIKWDMHCWQSEFRIIKRGAETEMWVFFNMTAFPDRKVGASYNMFHEEFSYHTQ
ncbi:MAG: hypothetical protein ACOC5R_01100 [Elusimicrobiota bacterium]